MKFNDIFKIFANIYFIITLILLVISKSVPSLIHFNASDVMILILVAYIMINDKIDMYLH